MKTLLSTVAALTLTASSAFAQCSGHQEYRVTFEATWTDSSANAAIPGNAHFSPAFAATHAGNASLYSVGRTASAGITLMAETGKTSTLENEVAQFKAAGLLEDSGKGSRLDATGRTSITLTASDDNDHLTLVSMIAPSPDWFVGVDGFDLCKNGSWVGSTSFNLETYDAGTDSGATFAAGNQATSPATPVTYLNKDLEETSRKSNAVFGKIHIEKV